MTGGARRALIVATNTVTDQRLRRLRSPQQDADALGDVLRDPAIGGFHDDEPGRLPEVEDFAREAARQAAG